ncbi:MAG: 4Fe-4S binding protein [Gammaproteobacteria bacterium]|nr:4Fe-4S binding protein [Gammaproteobacteria bacterium]
MYRKVFGAPPGSDLAAEGQDTALDGNNAIALAEAGIAQHAVLGGSFPADDADSSWLSELEAGAANLYGAMLAAQSAEGPRGVVAAATGLALAGRRATAFLSGPDVAAAQDLLVAAAGQHAPLVVHLSNRALATHGGALGSGHEAFHMSADSGFFQLFAANVQQAVDFTYIARRAAEQALIPGMVVMDGEQTALAVQDVRLLSLQQIHGFVGAPGEEIAVPTAAQKLLFGETRRRVPRWHDLDQPVLNGALFGTESFALGTLAQRLYFDEHLKVSLAESFEQFARRTGRHYGPLSRHKLDDATIVLMAQGAAVETARAVADYVRDKHKIRIGVVGVHCLRPFPGAEIVRCVQGKKSVVVLERLAAPLADDPPLLREVRAGLDRALENGGRKESVDADYPVLSSGEQPKCFSVSYGLGGLPLRGSDLVSLCTELDKKKSSTLFLGIDFEHSCGEHPKREVLLDALRRAYPHASAMGARGSGAIPELRPAAAITIAVHRVHGRGGENLLGEASALLIALEGGRIRSRPAVFRENWATCCLDRLTHSAQDLQDPGDEMAVDLAVINTHRVPLPAAMKPVEGLRVGGVLLIRSNLPEQELWQALTPDVQKAIKERDLKIFCSNPDDECKQPDSSAETDLSGDYLLGSLFASLHNTGLLEHKARRIFSARQQELNGFPSQQRSLLVDAFQSGFEQLRSIDVSDLTVAESALCTGRDSEVPAAVRQLAQTDDHYASLPRFWDQVGVIHRDGEMESLTPDPYLATGTMPPLSSTFSDNSDSRGMLPIFDPTLCTGCGNCWTQCPDSAIGAVSISPVSLIDTGISCTGAEAVRPVASQLAARVISQNKGADAPPSTAGEMLEQAFAWLGEKMTLSDERRQAIENGLEAIIGELGSLPVAVTQPFFRGPEAKQKDSAELLSLAVNPSACKACGICIRACEPGALRAAQQDAKQLAEARNLWKTWARTPDTSGATIESISADAEIGPLAAILLSRYCQFAVAGGDRAEAGSGEKIAVRLALALTEYQRQPAVQSFARKLEETGEEINALIKETLAGVLPVEDLETVTEALSRIVTPQVDLKTLAGEIETAAADHTIDTADLLRLTDLSKQLTDCHWRLLSGETGLGRARFGLAVAPGSVADWAGTFPYNPFQVPVVLDMTGDAAQLAAGLLEGQLGETADAVRMLRQAQLELDKPTGGADWRREALTQITWKDLSDEELQLCPPLFLVGSDETLAGRGLAQVIWLLNSALPVKILVLDELDFGLSSKHAADAPQARSNNPRADFGLLALAQREAYIAQTSIANPVHLSQSILGALQFDGPALINVHAPSPERHGFSMDGAMEQARLAVASRTMPLFRYDPTGEGVFGTRLDLEGNLQPQQVLISAGDGEQQLTPVHWALTEKRFAGCFSVLADDDPAPVSFEEFFQLDAKNRSRKTPYITVGEEADEVRYRISTNLVAMAGKRIQIWRTLQELAGVVTPFTARVEEEIQARVADEHQAELGAQKQESEKQIQQLQQTVEMEIAAKIRGRLLELAVPKRS